MFLLVFILRYSILFVTAVWSLLITIALIFFSFNISISFLVNPIIKNFVPNLTIKDAYLDWDKESKVVVVSLQGVEYKNDSNLSTINLSQLGVNISLFKSIANKKIVFDLLSFHEITVFLEEYENGEIVFTLPQATTLEPVDIENSDVVVDIDTLQSKILTETVVNDSYASKIKELSKELKEGYRKPNSIIERVLQDVEILQDVDQLVVTNSVLEYKTYKNKEKTNTFNFKNISFLRDDGDIKITSNIAIPVEGNVASLNLKSVINKNDIFSFDVALKDFSVKDVSSYFYLIPESLASQEELKKVSAINILASLKLQGKYNLKQANFSDLNFDVNMQNGKFNYNKMLEHDLIVYNLVSNIKFNPANSTLLVNKLNLELEKGRKVSIPFIEGDFDAEEISLKANIDLNNHIKLTDIAIKTEKNLIKGGFGYRFKGQEKIDFNLNVKNIRFNDVLRYWPNISLPALQKYLDQSVANNPIVKSFSMDFSHNKATNRFNYKGNGELLNVNYNYIQGMPILNAENVKFNFNEDDVNVNYTEGKIKNFALQSGYVRVFGKKNKGDFDSVLINTDLDGSLPVLLSIVDNKELGFSDKNTLNYNNFEGDVKGNLLIEYNYLDENLVDIKSNSVVKNVKLKNVFSAKDFASEQVNVVVDRNKINLDSRGIFNDILAVDTKGTISLNNKDDENFNVTVNTLFDLKTLGSYKEFDGFSKYIVNNISGPTKAVIKYTNYKNGVSNLLLNANLAENSVNYKNIYTKGAKSPLNATINVDIKGDNADSILVNNVNIKGKDIDLTFNMKFNNNETLMQFNDVNINNFYKGISNIIVGDNVLDINLNGSSLNFAKAKSLVKYLSEVNKKEDSNNENLAEDPKQKERNQEPSGSYKIRAKLKSIYFDKPSKQISNVNINYVYNNNEVKTLTATGGYQNSPNSAYFNVLLANNLQSADGLNMQQINLQINNLGLVLGVLGMYDGIYYGYTQGSVYLTHLQEGGYTVAGPLNVNSFSLSGIPFSSSSIKFMYEDESLKLNEISLKGGLLNIDALGVVDLKEDNVDIKGHLIPVANIASILNTVPLINRLPVGDGIVKIPISLKGSVLNPDFSFSNK